LDNNLTCEIVPLEIDRKIATLLSNVEPPSNDDVIYMVNGDYYQYQNQNQEQYHVDKPHISCLTGDMVNQQERHSHHLKGSVRLMAL
jgi:hypothetical protein